MTECSECGVTTQGLLNVYRYGDAQGVYSGNLFATEICETCAHKWKDAPQQRTATGLSVGSIKAALSDLPSCDEPGCTETPEWWLERPDRETFHLCDWHLPDRLHNGGKPNVVTYSAVRWEER